MSPDERSSHMNGIWLCAIRSTRPVKPLMSLSPKAYPRQGKAEEALACANSLVSRRPGFPASYALRGSLLHNRFDRYEDAIADHVKAISLGGREGIMFRNCGMFLVMGGRAEEAVHQFVQAIKYDPKTYVPTRYLRSFT